MKILFVKILLCCIVNAQATIKIYNQGHALVQQKHIDKLAKTGSQKLLLQDLPLNIDPSSINLFSNNVEFLSIEYNYNPISTKSLLDANIGNELELIKYNKNGEIIFSTIGRLIDNNNETIFEIDNKIVINPPYNYIFSNIPENIKRYPFINCDIISSSKEANYNLSYFINNIDWQAEYILYIDNNYSEMEAWYYINNNNNYTYNNAKITLVSGDINFYEKNLKYQNNSLKYSSLNRASNNEFINSEIDKTEDHFVYNIKNKMTLAPNSKTKIKFFNKDNLNYKNVYHISHSLSRHHWKDYEQNTNIPVFIRIEIIASDIGNFQIPSGQYMVYNKNNTELTYIGTAFHSIVSNQDIIKLELGKSHDIICSFNIKGYKINKNHGGAQLDAFFENRKNKAITIEWAELFKESSWKIEKTNHEYTQIDAHTIKYYIDIPANSTKTISFFAKMEKITNH